MICELCKQEIRDGQTYCKLPNGWKESLEKKEEKEVNLNNMTSKIKEIAESLREELENLSTEDKVHLITYDFHKMDKKRLVKYLSSLIDSCTMTIKCKPINQEQINWE